MMQFFAPTLVVISLVMACFTAPDGNGVWVDPHAILSVTHSNDGAPGSNAKISTSNGTFFVHETPQEILKIIENPK